MPDQIQQIQSETDAIREKQRKAIVVEYVRLLRLLIDGVQLSGPDRTSMASVMATLGIDVETVHADRDWFQSRLDTLAEVGEIKAELAAMREPVSVGVRIKEIEAEIKRLTEPLLRERAELDMESERRLSLDDRLRARRLYLKNPRGNESNYDRVERTRARTRDIISTGAFDE